MDNNENKYKLIKSEQTLYKKPNIKMSPNLNLGSSINMGFKNTDVRMGLGIGNRDSNKVYGNSLSKIISDSNDPLGIKVVISKNQSDMYKKMWSSTPKFDQAIEGLKKRESIIQQISMLPDSNWKRTFEFAVKTNTISNLDVTTILRQKINIDDEVKKTLMSIEPAKNLSYITKKYYQNYSGIKYKDSQPYWKDKETDVYVNVDDVDKLEEISNNESLDIDRKEMVNFILYAQEYPMLLNEHPVGQKIFEYTKTLRPVKLKGALYLYRMRTSNERNPFFSHEEMLKPPYGISQGGRFDQYGNSVLYTTNSLEISMLETYSQSNSHKYYIARKLEYDNTLKIADLTSENKWIDYLLRTKKSKQGEEYIIPRFVAQCLKYNGFEGFIVNSIHSKKDEKNYIFFDYKKSDFNIVNDYSYTDEEVKAYIDSYKENE